MSKRSPVPLSELGARIETVTVRGESVRALWFDCPREGCEHHPIMVPFDAVRRHIDGLGGVWEHVSGQAIKDITISPSVRSRCGTCEVHGWVRVGRWHSC